MKPIMTACDRCGLRVVRYELEQRGIIMSFCDECYWGKGQLHDRVEPREEEMAEPRSAVRR
jgi:hypothetical protein